MKDAATWEAMVGLVKGTSNAELPLVGLLDPRGLNLNLLGLPLLGKK